MLFVVYKQQKQKYKHGKSLLRLLVQSTLDGYLTATEDIDFEPRLLNMND